jgi:hypothetical protein
MDRSTYFGNPPINILGLIPGKTTKARVQDMTLKDDVQSVEIENLVDDNHLKIQNLSMIVACIKPEMREFRTRAEGLTFFFYKDVLESLRIHLPKPLGAPPDRLANGFLRLGEYIENSLFGKPPSLIQTKSKEVWQLGWDFEPFHAVLTLERSEQLTKKPMVYLIYGDNDLLLLKEKEERKSLRRFKSYFKKQIEQ